LENRIGFGQSFSLKLSHPYIAGSNKKIIIARHLNIMKNETREGGLVLQPGG